TTTRRSTTAMAIPTPAAPRFLDACDNLPLLEISTLRRPVYLPEVDQDLPGSPGHLLVKIVEREQFQPTAKAALRVVDTNLGWRRAAVQRILGRIATEHVSRVCRRAILVPDGPTTVLKLGE